MRLVGATGSGLERLNAFSVFWGARQPRQPRQLRRARQAG